MIKTKIVDLEELYNFVVNNHFIWNHLPRNIMFEFLIFEIQNFQMTSDGELTKIKVVVLHYIYNFAVEDFFIWVCSGFQIHISKWGKVNKGI
jgi:hypothetical protein